MLCRPRSVTQRHTSFRSFNTCCQKNWLWWCKANHSSLRTRHPWLLQESTALGHHANRARLYDINGKFLTAMPTTEAELLVDRGGAKRISRPGECPLRIRLLVARTWQPKPLTPTSGCTAPACITHRESEINALSAVGLGLGEQRSVVSRAQTKIREWKTRTSAEAAPVQPPLFAPQRSMDPKEGSQR